jgi:HEAT repeat protein
VPVKERETSVRRTIYLAQKRGELPFVQTLFDGPPALMSCGQRRNSTVALQPLFLLNDPTTARYAEAFAERIIRAAGNDPSEQTRQATLIALGREPEEDEQALFLQFLRDDEAATTDLTKDAQHERLALLCHTLLNLNEFLYIP